MAGPTYTYDDTEVKDKDKLRGIIGDTDSSDWLFSDEALVAKIASENSIKGAAIALIKNLISKYSRSVNRSNGKISRQLSDIVKNYRTLLNQLLIEGIGASKMTGSFIKEEAPIFTIDMQSNDPPPGSGTGAPGDHEGGQPNE